MNDTSPFLHLLSHFPSLIFSICTLLSQSTIFMVVSLVNGMDSFGMVLVVRSHLDRHSSDVWIKASLALAAHRGGWLQLTHWSRYQLGVGYTVWRQRHLSRSLPDTCCRKRIQTRQRDLNREICALCSRDRTWYDISTVDIEITGCSRERETNVILRVGRKVTPWLPVHCPWTIGVINQINYCIGAKWFLPSAPLLRYSC